MALLVSKSSSPSCLRLSLPSPPVTRFFPQVLQPGRHRNYSRTSTASVNNPPKPSRPAPRVNIGGPNQIADTDLITSLRPHLLVHVARSRTDSSLGEFRKNTLSEKQISDVCDQVFAKLRAGGQDPHHMPFPKVLANVCQQIDAEIATAAHMTSNTIQQLAGYKKWGSRIRTVTPGEMAEIMHTVKKMPRHQNHMLPAQLFQDQLQVEEEAVTAAVERYQKLAHEVTVLGKGAQLRPAQKVLLSWFTPLSNAIEAERKEMQANKGNHDQKMLAPYLLKLRSGELATIVMHEIINIFLLESVHDSSTPMADSKGNKFVERTSMDPDSDTVWHCGVRFAHCAQRVGKAVNAECNLAMLRRDNQAFGALNKQHGTMSVGGYMLPVPVVHREASRRLGTDAEWDSAIVMKIGALLIQKLIDVAHLDQMGTQVPAFRHFVETMHMGDGRIKQLGLLRWNNALFQIIQDGHDFFAQLHPRMKPMLVPPRPWTSYDDGGYLSTKNLVMRMKGSTKQAEALRDARVTTLFDGLDYLGQVPWKINLPVLDIIKKVWEEGGGQAELPLRADLPLPEKPIKTGDLSRDIFAFKQWQRELARARKTNTELHALRCDFELKLAVAESCTKVNSFYFPYNIDFRGRAYPIPPHLNHIGSDLCRGMLCFDEKRPLGASGLRWLKIHLANLYGKDKLSFDGRVAWTDNEMPQILACADDPLNLKEANKGKPRWFMAADKPWQCLAVALELAAAVRSPDPESYMCSMPVHQDGSCNGLQHYAALGRDVVGGASVNLSPGSKPADLYSEVAAEVSRRVEKDAADGNPIAQNLVGKINRKIVKQTVMTSVYGVTLIGARLQISDRLAERADIQFAEPREKNRSIAALYLAKTTFASLGHMFNSANEIMIWLATCAKILAKVCNQPISWLSPIGLPVVQPYRRKETHTVKTLMQTVVMVRQSDDLPVNVARQKAAFPPNFVHSLDASHMLMTALECKRLGMVFSAVHDSYWTHPSDMEKMNHALRKCFLDLYSQPILESLHASLTRRFPDVPFPAVPKRGELNLKNVLNSPYFFS